MVQDCRDVTNSIANRYAGDPQRKVIVLAAFKAAPETPHLVDQDAPVDNEMVEKVLTKQKIRIPIGLEIRIRSAPIGIHLVFITIDNVRVWTSFQLSRHLVERMLG